MEEPEKQTYDLNYLSRESWQLELLVSGILLLLLFSSDDWTKGVAASASVRFQGGITGIIGLLMLGIPLAISISKVFFIFHVLVRGLWIGALGLRSVSGDIDIKGQNFNLWFNKYLFKYQGGFDPYILRLERLASVVFSFNFLLIFYMFSSLLIMGWVSLVSILGNLVHNSFFILAVVLSIGMTLCLIDFMTLQLLKKGKFGYVYYPFYWIVNVLSLSFLFRPLHYNFIDHKYTRRLLIGLIFFVFGLFVVNGIRFHLSPWLLRVPPTSSVSYLPDNYKESANDELVQHPFLSHFENASLLKLTTPLKQSDRFQQYLYHVCPDLEKHQNMSWYKINTSGGNLTFSTALDRGGSEELNQIVDCYAQAQRYRIDDSNVTPSSFYFLFKPNADSPTGMQSIISVENLPKGPHTLEIMNYYIMNDSVRHQSYFIPFYKTD